MKWAEPPQSSSPLFILYCQHSSGSLATPLRLTQEQTSSNWILDSFQLPVPSLSLVAVRFHSLCTVRRCWAELDHRRELLCCPISRVILMAFHRSSSSIASIYERNRSSVLRNKRFFDANRGRDLSNVVKMLKSPERLIFVLHVYDQKRSPPASALNYDIEWKRSLGIVRSRGDLVTQLAEVAFLRRFPLNRYRPPLNKYLNYAVRFV